MEQGPKVLCESYSNDFVYLLDIVPETHVAEFKAAEPELSAYHDEIFKFREAARRIQSRCMMFRLRFFHFAILSVDCVLSHRSDDVVQFQCVAVDCTQLKEDLSSRASRVADLLLQEVEEQTHQLITDGGASFPFCLLLNTTR